MRELSVCRHACVCPTARPDLHFHPGGPLCTMLAVPQMQSPYSAHNPLSMLR